MKPQTTASPPCRTSLRPAACLGAAVRLPLTVILALLCMAFSGVTASQALAIASDGLLPQVCPEGWLREGEVRHYTKDNLYEYINGEAELFFPFGFEDLATAAYARRTDPRVALVADIYRMGSVLSAFGVYSNYRNPKDDVHQIGAQGSSNPAQLLFYQDRYFVRLSVSGSAEEDPSVFRAFGEMIAAKIPGGPSRPRELEFLKVPGAVEKTEKYIAASVLGYPFFRRGMVAEVAVGSGRVKAFVLLHSSVREAGQSLEAYLASLRDRGVQPDLRDTAAGTELFARDPLYGGLILRRSSTFLIGAARVASAGEGRAILDALQSRLPAGG